MEKKTVFILTMLWILTATVHAEVITIFDSNSIITDASEPNSFDTVIIKGDGTVVDMTGGTVNKLITMNASTFNMSGGTITSETCSHDLSKVNLSGGIVGHVYSSGESTTNISGDASISSGAYLYSSSLVIISSDDVTVGSGVCLTGDSTLNITGGVVIDDLFMCHPGTTIYISGGSINYIMADSSSGVINIIGYDLSALPYGGNFGDGEITGYWNNDDPINISLCGTQMYDFVTLYDGIIPPVCTKRPHGDLSGDCKVDNIDLAKMALEWLQDGTE